LLKKWKQGTSLSFTAGRVSRFSRDFSSVARKSSEINAFPRTPATLQADDGGEQENPDFAAVERLLKTDLTLSYKIMRYVRNMLFKSHGIIQADNLT
jgi:hypothetical protein